MYEESRAVSFRRKTVLSPGAYHMTQPFRQLGTEPEWLAGSGHFFPCLETSTLLSWQLAWQKGLRGCRVNRAFSQVARGHLYAFHFWENSHIFWV